jgi:NTE family protein
MKTGLVLAGGGARAAYQVGVLSAIKEILLRREGGNLKSDALTLPFAVLSGTSAGALNAAALACYAHNFVQAVTKLEQTWSLLKTEQVYRVDPLGLSITGMRWLGTLALGWIAHQNPQALFDNRPLINLINRLFHPNKVNQAIQQGLLEALAISASSYTSGQHMVFFQAQRAFKPWAKARRCAIPCQITAAHLLASSAIPLIFPAVSLPYMGHREYFGDGAIRQMTPLSPAVHLGAQKIMVIESSSPGPTYPATGKINYPSLAQITGHALTSLFVDSLANDIENIERLNQVLSRLPKHEQNQQKLHHIDVLVFSPSQNLESLALPRLSAFPRGLRVLLRGIGISKHNGATLLSYLLFEKAYTEELIALGKADALAREAEILRFFA